MEAPTPTPPGPTASTSVAITATASASSSATEGPWPAQQATWSYASSPIGKTSVVVVSPPTSERLPVLIALHGLGEAQKGPDRGARGWIDDYGLLVAIDRLAAP